LEASNRLGCKMSSSTAPRGVKQDRQEVIINLGRIGAASLIKLQLSMAPERDLLQTEYVGSHGRDLIGKQLAAGGEIGTVDHLPQLVVGMTRASTRSPPTGRSWRVLSG
jgi:hypothetical protein